MAAGKAVEMGYRNVYWYRDGISGWRKKHLAFESADFAFMSRPLPPPLEPRDLINALQEDSALVLVDIRDEASKKKFGKFDAPALSIPLYRLHQELNTLPKNKKLVLCDIKAKQAPSACRYLMDKRFPITRITYLKGGFLAWKEQGLPTKE
jgi:rhodanese-related sulfurtransferase